MHAAQPQDTLDWTAVLAMGCSGLFAFIGAAWGVVHGLLAVLTATGAFLGGLAAFGQLVRSLRRDGFFAEIASRFRRLKGGRRKSTSKRGA